MYASKYNLIFDARKQDCFLIMNPLSGAMDFIDSRAVSLVHRPDDQEAHLSFPEFYQYCRDRGYLYDSAGDEEVALEAAHKKSSALYLAEPFRADVYLTYLCNLRCTYCFQGHRLHRGGGVMQPDVIDALFSALDEFRRRWGSPQPPVLTLIGGEPLLKRRSQSEAVARILDLCSLKGYRARIVTNGVDLASYSEMLAKYNLDFIQVTLDGPRQVHDRRRIFADGEGSFDYIVAGIDKTLERGLHVVTRVNIDAQNVGLLPDLADFILEKGWLNKGMVVGVTPVDEFVPESEWCAEQTKIETLKRLLEVKREYRQTAFMIVGYRLAQFFEHVVDNGHLPAPTLKYCPAVIGNQVSFDHEGKMFACC
jgi:uncharacterized protein